MARPPKPEKERRSVMVHVRLTPPEYRRFKAEARRKKSSVGGLIRDAALQQIEDGGESRKEKP